MRYPHYAHCINLRVKTGDYAKKGQLIAQVGKTGNAAGVHCHFEVLKVDPLARGRNRYTTGMSPADVLGVYADPRNLIDEQSALPCPWTNKQAGYKFLQITDSGLIHPGIDINSGVGDQDLGNEIRAVGDGPVLFAGYDKGWGYHIFQKLDGEQKDMTQKILVHAVGLKPEDIEDNYRAAEEFVAKITGGEFRISFDIIYRPYEVLDLSREYLHPDGLPYWGIDPRYQKQWSQGRSHRFTQLAYDAARMHPDKRLFSLAYREPAGETQHNQINGGFHLPVPVEHTIVHELSHSWHFSLGIPDVTHQIEEEERKKDSTNSRPRALKRLIEQLKPHWPELTNAFGQADEEIDDMIAYNYKGTIYVPVFAKWVGIADQDSFLELGGRWENVDEINESEFNRLIKPRLAKQTILK